jgi:hypothetical protein
MTFLFLEILLVFPYTLLVYMHIFLFHSDGLVPKFLTITEPECPHGHMRWDGMIPSMMYLGSHGNISFISPPKGENKIYWVGPKPFVPLSAIA